MVTTSATSANSSSAADLYASLNGSKSTASTSSTEDMQNRFLTLLTTQLKNQDPLNPLDNSQVTSQLAQINTVNGIEQLNSTLGKLLSAYDDSQSMQTAAMLGKTVLVPGDNLMVTASGEAIGGVLLDADASQVTVNVLNSSGKVIQTENLGAKSAGSFGFSWDGKDSNGNAAPAGAYHFSVQATKGSDAIKATALQAGTVNAAVRSKSGFELDLGDAGLFQFSDVQQIL